jgi:hypothetical protein
MYRSSAKLPDYWERAGSGTTTPTYGVMYRRSPLSRNYRFLILLAICLLAWHHYSTTSPFEEERDTFVDSQIQEAYPQDRNEQQKSMYQEAVRILEEAKQAIEEKKAEAVEAVEAVKAAPLLKERSEDPEPQSPPSENVAEVTPVYAEDETTPKEAVLDSRRKPDSKGSKGDVEVIDHEPPALVKQASEKMIEQHLTPAVKYEESAISKKPQPQVGEPVKFPPYLDYAELNDRAETLPDIVHTPFEVSTADVVLEGWEDLWYSEAELDIERWGKINEPKIDFVYTCKTFPCKIVIGVLIFWRGQWF